MSLNIGIRCASVPSLGTHPFNDSHITRSYRHIIATGNPIFRARMAKSKRCRW